MALKEGLFGEEGKVTFKNSRTKLSFNSEGVDDTAGTLTFDKKHLFVTGHKVQLTEDLSGALPTGLSAATDYFVIVVEDKVIKLAATDEDALAGTAIALTDAGTGENHLIALQEYDLLASCKNWNINFEKAIAETTTLGDSFRSYKGGMINATGSMTVMYEAASKLDSKKARKIFDSFILPYDDGDGSVELFLSDTDVSRKIEAEVIFTSASISAELGSIIEAQVNFQLNGKPTFTDFS